MIFTILLIVIVTFHQYRSITITSAMKAIKVIGKRNISKVKDLTNPIKSTTASFSLTRDKEKAYCDDNTYVFGVDEAGRGPLAGPVVTAACYIDNDVYIHGINDSKQTKEHDRETMYNTLINHPNVLWTVSIVSHTEIDEVNILQGSWISYIVDNCVF